MISICYFKKIKLLEFYLEAWISSQQAYFSGSLAAFYGHVTEAGPMAFIKSSIYLKKKKSLCSIHTGLWKKWELHHMCLAMQNRHCIHIICRHFCVYQGILKSHLWLWFRLYNKWVKVPFFSLSFFPSFLPSSHPFSTVLFSAKEKEKEKTIFCISLIFLKWYKYNNAKNINAIKWWRFLKIRNLLFTLVCT